MKLTKKTLGIACAALAAAVMTFTGCDGFGKDDFYGTWESHYKIPGTKTDAAGAGWFRDQANCDVDLTMYFSGTSEDLLNKGAVFYQNKIRHAADDSTKVAQTTFWYGTYKLANNSNYDKGDLILSYKYGFTLGSEQKLVLTEDKDVPVKEKKGDVTYVLKKGTYDADVLSKLALGKATTDYIVNKGDNTKTCDDPENAMYIAYTGFKTAGLAVQSKIESVPAGDGKTKLVCKDVERFTFELGDADFFKGYTSMTATEKDSWDESITSGSGSKDSPVIGCSWEVKSRSFNLAKDNGKDAKGVTELLSGVTADSGDRNDSIVGVPGVWAPCLK